MELGTERKGEIMQGGLGRRVVGYKSSWHDGKTRGHRDEEARTTLLLQIAVGICMTIR